MPLRLALGDDYREHRTTPLFRFHKGHFESIKIGNAPASDHSDRDKLDDLTEKVAIRSSTPGGWRDA
jgi:hypothetical protein